MGDKAKILAALLVILAGLLTYRLLNPFQQLTVEQLTFTGRAAVGKVAPRLETEKSRGKTDQGDLLIGLFVNPPKHSAATLKNVFFPIPPRGEGEKPTVLSQPAAVTEDEKGPDLSPTTPGGLSDIHVFGSYRNENDTVLFIERGKDILTVRPGDRIDGKYLVKAITETGMVVTVNDDDIVVDFDIQ